MASGVSVLKASKVPNVREILTTVSPTPALTVANVGMRSLRFPVCVQKVSQDLPVMSMSMTASPLLVIEEGV